MLISCLDPNLGDPLTTLTTIVRRLLTPDLRVDGTTDQFDHVDSGVADNCEIGEEQLTEVHLYVFCVVLGF